MPAVNITQPVGSKGKNLPTEERAIQDLLRKTGIQFRAPRTLAGDIEAFQRMCHLQPDGRVDPHGTTLRWLNAVVNQPKLVIAADVPLGEGSGKSTVSSQTILKGGYGISYHTEDGGRGDTKIPAPYQLLLGPDQMNAIDVSERPRTDLLDAATLAKLLAIIDARGVWASTLPLKLFVTLERQVISSSPPANLRCPVKPHTGKMLSSSENGDLFYLGDVAAKNYFGRMFQTVPGFNKYLFCWGGRFELDPAKRGFDCITFAGTTCGAKHTDMRGKGADLAAALGATPVIHDKVTLDNAKMANLKRFFETNKTGHYILYSTGHVTLVVDDYVYEFKPNQPGNKGFVPTKTTDWVGTHQDGWTLRKLPSKPLLANA